MFEVREKHDKYLVGKEMGNGWIPYLKFTDREEAEKVKDFLNGGENYAVIC